MLAAIRRAPHSAAELSIDAIKASASDSERNNYTYLCMKAKGYVLAKDLTKDCTVYALVGYVGSEIKEDCYRIPPYSARAQILAAICIVVAAMARTVVGMAGSDQRFVTYYPAIMAASLLASVPAGISVAVGATLITWLVLIPPLMSRPTPAMDLFIFLISSGFIIIFAYCCRLVLNRLRQSGIAPGHSD